MVTRAPSVDIIDPNPKLEKNERINKSVFPYSVTFEADSAPRTFAVKNYIESINTVKSSENLKNHTVVHFAKAEINQAFKDLKLEQDIAAMQKELDAIQFVGGEAIIVKEAITPVSTAKKQESPMNLFSSTKMNTADNDKKATGDNKKPISFYYLYIRYMDLMQRILGQAEADANDLYQKIKARTDEVGVLSDFIARINNAPGAIDWSKNEEMKKLINQVRELGVAIPEGKCMWSVEEKKLLKETVQTTKESKERMTQSDKSDMQKFLQEASQMHQGKSNLLKQLGELMNVIIRNMGV